MKKLLKYFLVCTLLCAAIAGISTAFADVCPVHGSQHLFTEEGYEAAHPHKDYEACKCGYANYTGGTRMLDDCKECHICPVYGLQHLFTEEGYEAAHPHKDYEACKCGYANYTGGTRMLDDCTECYPEDNGPAHTPDYPETDTCEHASKAKTNTQIEYYPDYEFEPTTHHAIIHIYSWICINCDKIFDPITEFICWDAHSFNSQGVCKKCNYCTHKNIRKEYLGEGTVINKDDYDYHYIEMPYEGSCSYCGAVVDGTDEDYEFHEYDHDGWCFCGYYNEDYCPHDNTELRDAGYGYGVDGSIEETRHFTEHCYEEYCFDCDTIIGNGWDDSGEGNRWWEGYWEDHDFGADGYCVCGYYKEPEVCSHENSELRLTDTIYSMDEYDAEMHWAQHNYDVYCFDCKQVVNTTWEGQGEYHEFNESGYCSACGFQKAPSEITEPLQVTVSVWSGNALVGDRVGADATVSGGSGNYTCHWEASSDTQKYVQSGSNYTYRSWGYNANSACTWRIKVTVTDQVTGETKTANSSAIKVKEECLHTGERLDYGKTNLVVTYDFDSSKDILRHLVIYNETPLWTCADCKQEISGETQTSLNRKDFHTFDEDTNKCVCGANRIDNFNGRLSYKLREMVEENWDPYGKWTWSYEQWDDLYHNYSLYVSDRVIGTEYAQIVADMTAIAWMVADYADQLQYEKLKLWASITGLDTSNMTYESIVEKTRANVASEQGYLAAGLTTKQVGTVANIISESVAYAQEQAIKEYYKLNDEWVDIVELIDEVANDEEIVVKGSEWLFKVINNFDGMSSAEIVEKFGEMVKVNQEVADGFSNGLDAFGVLVDLYNVTLQAATIDTFTKAHIEYMENALSSIGRDQLPLRTTLQTLINETKDQYNNDWESYFNADLPEWTGSVEVYLTQYGNLAYEEVIDIGLGMAIDSIPGVGLVTIGFSVLDMFTGDKTDDLLSYKKTYEIAEGSRDSLLSAIDALSDPLTQSQLDALKTKIVFYASSCQTLSNAYNGVIQYDAKKGLPISTSSYSGEDFIAETSAYIDLFKRY